MKKILIGIILSNILLMADSGLETGLQTLRAIVGTVKSGLETGLQTFREKVGAVESATDIAPEVSKSNLSPKAQRLYRDCNEGNTSTSIASCDELAILFSKGDGVPFRPELSYKFYDKASDYLFKICKNGDANSCKIWLERSRIDNRYDIAFAQEKLCKSGMPKNCYELGKLYEEDNNYQKAIEYYQIGCDYTHEDSCNRLKALQ